ncbi:MAG: hypothetical protein VKL20_03560 [Synechocystis sp.]|nr:hypothetical protein [Synechocystis sp.]
MIFPTFMTAKKLWTGALALTMAGAMPLPVLAQSLPASGTADTLLIAQQIDLDEVQRQLEQNPQLIQQAQQLLRENPELVQQTMQQLLQNNPTLIQDIQQRPELMQQVGRQTGGSTEINEFIRQNPDLYEQLKNSLPPQ